MRCGYIVNAYSYAVRRAPTTYTWCDKSNDVVYTAVRCLPPLVALILWAWLGEGTWLDPANILLLLAVGSAVWAWAAIRRYWHIRNTSRSRRDSSLLA